jgi:hypothetical protein
MEAGIVAALSYWGVTTGDSTVAKILLGIVTPVTGFAVWGAMDFHQAGRYAEALPLVEELVISGLTAVGLYAAGARALGLALAALSIVYHVLVYAFGKRLLKPKS